MNDEQFIRKGLVFLASLYGVMALAAMIGVAVFFGGGALVFCVMTFCLGVSAGTMIGLLFFTDVPDFLFRLWGLTDRDDVV